MSSQTTLIDLISILYTHGQNPDCAAVSFPCGLRGKAITIQQKPRFLPEIICYVFQRDAQFILNQSHICLHGTAWSKTQIVKRYEGLQNCNTQQGI